MCDKLSKAGDPAVGSTRLVRAWDRTSRRYHSDCNMRLLRQPDAKRNRLREKSEEAFKAMMRSFRDSPNTELRHGAKTPNV